MAIAEPADASDLLEAYQAMLDKVNEEGGVLTVNCKEVFCRTADELYYWVRYGGEEPDEANDQLKDAIIRNTEGVGITTSSTHPVAFNALTDPNAMRKLRRSAGLVSDEEVESVEQESSNSFSMFVGWQAKALDDSLAAGENVLLAGPTGTGKTFALLEVARLNPLYNLTIIEGKEGLIDLDFLGAILPTEDGKRVWTDGPVLRAMRQAQTDPVVLFMDEINRVPRRQINLLLGLMNPKTTLKVDGQGQFYVVEVPMTSEIVWCPTAHLRIVGAGNFGRSYAVYDLDPALRRRFDTVIEFDYLPANKELDLVMRESNLSKRVARALISVAAETRRMMSNGELPGCVDTASLLNWARKCSRVGSDTAADLMRQARMTWADMVCGREHTGQINQGNFDALVDYLNALGQLPQGGES
jgi:MoxR-like ATPase